jgi:hypothetical protein
MLTGTPVIKQVAADLVADVDQDEETGQGAGLEFSKYLEPSSPDRGEDVDALKKQISDLENVNRELIE